MYQLKKKIIIEGTIKALTGLHIGGTNSSMAIGGTDKAVIRNPITNKPYIPGSSLKGKMRSLVELNEGTIGNTKMGAVENGPTQDSSTLAAKLFGTANQTEKQRPSRVIVRDGNMTSDENLFNNTDLPYTETKTEVVIDRITSKAMPRQIERVPAGAEFELKIVLNIFNEDDESTLLPALIRSLQLVQDDYLGGNGSRGSGQVKFSITSIKERTTQFYLGDDTAETDIMATSNIPGELKGSVAV